MTQPAYVQWAPGINAAQSLEIMPLVARRVPRVPEVAEIRNESAAAWFERPQLANLIAETDHQPGKPATRVAILCDGKCLFVAFDCLEPDPQKMRRLIPADAPNGELKIAEGFLTRVVDHDDHVSVRIDPTHNHKDTIYLQVNVNGARRASKISSTMSWAAVPRITGDEKVELSWESAVAELPDRWRCGIKIDLVSLKIDSSQPTVGLQLERARYGNCLQQFMSSPTLHAPIAAPLAFNDLYLEDTGVTVENITWEGRGTGDNNLSLLVSARENRAVRAIVQLQSKNHKASFESSTVDIPAGKSVPVKPLYQQPHNLSSMSLVVDLQDAKTGRSLFKGSLPLGSHADMNVPHTYRGKGLASNPNPGDADFHEKKLAYILSRLPRFVRRNTAQGAPSDFTIQSVDGKVTFNLMQPGVMSQIGKWIDSLFDNAIDRICAAAVFSNDDAITTHCAARVSMHDHLTPLSAIRLGAGHCYSRAMAGAGIVSAVTDPRTGRKFEAYPVLILGHVVVAIRWRDSFTFIDPSFGHFFFAKDNGDLALDTEIAADEQLIRRVWNNDVGVGMYSRRQVHVRLEHGTVVWPPGAPAE